MGQRQPLSTSDRNAMVSFTFGISPFTQTLNNCLYRNAVVERPSPSRLGVSLHGCRIYQMLHRRLHGCRCYIDVYHFIDAISTGGHLFCALYRKPIQKMNYTYLNTTTTTRSHDPGNDGQRLRHWGIVHRHDSPTLWKYVNISI